MEAPRPITTFSELLVFLNSIPRINNGGCAISALTIYRWLKARKEKAQIVYYYDDDAMYCKEQNSYLKRRMYHAEPNGCSHAYVKYNGKLYDSLGWHIDNRKHHILSEQFAVVTINEARNWVKSFNRSHVVTIQHYTGVDLRDVEY